MKLFVHNDQRGLAGSVIAIIIAVVVIAGGAGVYAYTKSKDKDKSDSGTGATSETTANIDPACKAKFEDDDLCRFAVNNGLDGMYKATIISTSPNGTTELVMRVSGDKSYTTASVDGTVQSEVIRIGSVLYSKDASDGSWTKFDTGTTVDENPADDITFDYEDDAKITYKALGREACGDKTCFKYQVVDADTPDQEHFLWFDDDEYKIRRMTVSSAEGSTEITYAYELINIEIPSPIKEVPGLSEETQQQIRDALQQIGQ